MARPRPTYAGSPGARCSASSWRGGTGWLSSARAVIVSSSSCSGARALALSWHRCYGVWPFPKPKRSEHIVRRAPALHLVPTSIQILLTRPGIRERTFPQLRTMLYGASPIALDLLREATEVFGCEFVQQYGMTETCATVVYLPHCEEREHGVN
ncbi:AMP-binding protein [Novosphingobium sp. BW1]|uniref:AMP-binding protein n=1 Tax=Novosphingobium sp. BW1 TaxID=2592621 RepID=UPI0021101211|nr:AMP-binding protein [Novosphingobium sp. BW1]